MLTKYNAGASTHHCRRPISHHTPSTSRINPITPTAFPSHSIHVILLSNRIDVAATIPSLTHRPASTGGSVSMCRKSRFTPYIRRNLYFPSRNGVGESGSNSALIAFGSTLSENCVVGPVVVGIVVGR